MYILFAKNKNKLHLSRYSIISIWSQYRITFVEINLYNCNDVWKLVSIDIENAAIFHVSGYNQIIYLKNHLSILFLKN